jgi:N-acyl-D-aspartate/D-glutamate deacylase
MVLRWTENACRDALVFPVNTCVPLNYEFTLDTIGLFDQLPAWNEATVGTFDERRAKLSDPARRTALRRDAEGDAGFGTARNKDGEAGQISMFRWNNIFIAETALRRNKTLEGMTIDEFSRQQSKHPVDAMLDLAIEEDLRTEFAMPGFANTDDEAVSEIVKHPLTLVGSSDGGAHTKFLTSGRYPTHFLAHLVRDKQAMSIEEAHWRLSTMIGWAIGIRDRGWLREGMPADIVIYDLEKLRMKATETVFDLPGGDWRRVQKAEGYRYTIVNGQITFEDNRCTGALPGRVLRSYNMGG